MWDQSEHECDNQDGALDDIVELVLSGTMGKQNRRMNRKTIGTQRIMSRMFTQILRHTAGENGIEQQPDGYIPIDRLLSCKQIRRTGIKLTFDDIDRIIREYEQGKV